MMIYMPLNLGHLELLGIDGETNGDLVKWGDFALVLLASVTTYKAVALAASFDDVSQPAVLAVGPYAGALAALWTLDSMLGAPPSVAFAIVLTLVVCLILRLLKRP